jgi:IS1 family transposase
MVTYVNDRRTDAACQRLVKKIDGCQISRYHTDDRQSYRKFLPVEKHRVGKDGTRQIERHNLNFSDASEAVTAADDWLLEISGDA